MIPAYLTSGCIENRDLCQCANCRDAVKQNEDTKRFYITMGHAGFNTKTNNADGYPSERSARLVMARYLAR